MARADPPIQEVSPGVTSTTDRVLCGLESTLFKSLDKANRTAEAEHLLYVHEKKDNADLEKQVAAYKDLATTPPPVQVEKPFWVWPVVGAAGVVGLGLGVLLSITVINKTKSN